MKTAIFRTGLTFIMVVKILTCAAHGHPKQPVDPALQCFKYQMHGDPNKGILNGAVQNNCDKAVTAYELLVDISYMDGSNSEIVGTGIEYFGGLIAPIESKIGAIQIGEIRGADPMTLTLDKDKTVSAVSIRTGSIIYDDGSAFGDEGWINMTFKMRGKINNEWKFWNKFLSERKDQLLDPKAQISESDHKAIIDRIEKEAAVLKPVEINVTKRQYERFMLLLSLHKDAIKKGSCSRSKCENDILEYMNKLVEIGEKQARRRIQP